MRELTLTLLRELSADKFISGTALAAKHDVSRSAISDALKDAAQLGVHIFSLTRRGYRLAAPLEFLDVAVIQKNMGSTAPRLHLDIVDTIDSTNTALLARVAKNGVDRASSGICLAAEIQTAGRGRRSRVWQSALGASLTFSYLWRTDKSVQELGGLSLAVGLAVANALRALGVNAQVKWPNDILVDDKKLGGILIETQGDMLGPTAAVIGIGLNIKLPDDMKAAIDQPVTDLAEINTATDTTIGRNALFGAVLQNLVITLDDFEEDGFSSMRDQWRALNAFDGRIIDVVTAEEKFTAKVVDIAEDGALVVDRGSGRLRLTSADISVRVVKPAAMRHAS